MKMMFARCCDTLVVPHPTDRVVRRCKCKRSACWWESGAEGQFRMYNASGNMQMTEGLGLHNGLLSIHPDSYYALGTVSKTQFEVMLDATPDSYVFKQVGSMIIKFRPGYTNDVVFIADRNAVPSMEEETKIVQWKEQS